MEQKNERTDNGVGKEEQNKELIEAAKADDLKLVQELLSAGADANYQHEATVGWDSVVVSLRLPAYVHPFWMLSSHSHSHITCTL